MLQYINYLSTLLYMLNAGKKDLPKLVKSWPELMLQEFALLDGKGEDRLAGNNRGAFLDRIRRQDGRPVKSRVYGAWCAAVVLYVAQRSWAMTMDRKGWDYLTGSQQKKFPLAKTFGARKLWKSCCQEGSRLKGPEVGALVLWARGAQGSWEAHIGVVTRVDEVSGHWWYRAGNEGKLPAVIKESPGWKKRRLIGFARLPDAPTLKPLR